MKFRADEYFRAATERMRQARTMYNDGKSYSLAMYCAGLSVECILRAFRWERDQSFDGRHDLENLLKASALLRMKEERMQSRGISDESISDYGRRIRAAMNDVVALWRNELRFASESSLRAYLNRIGRVHGVKGDPLRKNAFDLLNAAQTIVDRGVVLWTSRKK